MKDVELEKTEPESYSSLWSVVCAFIMILAVLVAPIYFMPDHVADGNEMIDSTSISRMGVVDSVKTWSDYRQLVGGQRIIRFDGRNDYLLSDSRFNELYRKAEEKRIKDDSLRLHTEPTVTLLSINAKLDRIEKRLKSLQRQRKINLLQEK